MQRLLTQGEPGDGILILSWKEFEKNAKHFSADCVVRGIRLFSSQSNNPKAVLRLIVKHPASETILSRLHTYGEIMAGYLLEVLKLVLKKIYKHCADIIDTCKFERRDEVLLLLNSLKRSSGRIAA